jgi:nucleotide-binding universal stress UspA family protein
MKFLVAVGSREYSKSTLRLGAQIAQTFGASVSVVYVGSKPREIIADQIELTRGNLSKWQIYHPGVDVLHWAFKEIQKICPEGSELRKLNFDPANLIEEEDRFRLALPGGSTCNVELLLREGEIISELRDELQSHKYDLAIIGGSQKNRRMAHDLIQYLPSSVFVIQNLDLRRNYRVLLLVDDSEATKRSVQLGATIARQMGYPIRTLTVSKTRRFGPGYMGAAEHARELLEKEGLEVEQFFLTGDPVKTFVDFAGENHIVVMGASGKNAFKKLFMGSKPIQTLKRVRGPMLIVR